MIILIAFIAHWYLSLFVQTFFHHRYAAHGMFTMSKPWERFFYILSFLFQGAHYLSPRTYGILHRLHHAYADTENDPHSPQNDPNLFSMMWNTRLVYNDIDFGRVTHPENFTRNLPDWTAFDKFASARITRLFWIVFYTLFYIQFATAWWMFLLIPVHVVLGPLHGVIINWFAHKYGYTNHGLKDTSKNLLPVDFLMLGEAYHNNHHKNGNDPNFGDKWYEIDPIYPIIKLLNSIGIVRLKKI